MTKVGYYKDYDIFENHGHYEVHINGKFYCSADSVIEALEEIMKHERE